MTKKAISIFMAATCSIVIIAPGRLVCGIIVAFEIFLLMIFGDLFKALLDILKINKLKQTCLLIFVVYLTQMYKQILALFMPQVALQMGFLLFLPSISTFTTVFLLDEKKSDLVENLKDNIPTTVLFSGYCLLISFVRDILGYGTITLPRYKIPLEIVIFDNYRISAASFLATIPGALIITSVFLAVYLQFEKKFHILEKAGIK